MERGLPLQLKAIFLMKNNNPRGLQTMSNYCVQHTARTVKSQGGTQREPWAHSQGKQKFMKFMDPPKSGQTLPCQGPHLQPQVRPLSLLKKSKKIPQGRWGKLESSSEHRAGLSWVYLSTAQSFGVWAGAGPSTEPLRFPVPSQLFAGSSEPVWVVPSCAGWEQAELTHMGYMAHFQCVPLIFVILHSPLIENLPIFLTFQWFLLICLCFLSFIMEATLSSADTQVLYLPEAKLSLFVSSWEKKLLNCVH